MFIFLDQVGVTCRNPQGIVVLDHLLQLSCRRSIRSGSIANSKVGFLTEFIVEHDAGNEIGKIPFGVCIPWEQPITVQLGNFIIQGRKYPELLIVKSKTKSYLML